MNRFRPFSHWFGGAVLAILVMGVVIDQGLRHFFDHDATAIWRRHAATYATMWSALLAEERDGAAPGPSAALQARWRQFSTQSGMRLELLDDQGHVRFDTQGQGASQGDRHGVEITQARELGEGFAIGYDADLRESVMALALPVRKGAALTGYVRLSRSRDRIQERLDQARRIVVFSTVGAIVLAALMIAWSTRRTQRTLQHMADAAQAIAQGDPGPVLPIADTGVLGRLALAFEAMALELNAKIEALRLERDRMLRVFSGMVEGVIAVDGDDRVIHVNQAAQRLFEGSPSGMIGRHFLELVHAPLPADLLDAAKRHGRRRQGIMRLSRSGADAVLEVTVSPLKARDGYQGAVLVFHEVTELRRLEAMRRDFVANVSHELKTPLTAIKGFLETLRDDRAMPQDTRRHFLERIDENTERLCNIVNDLLALSRIESDAQPSERRPIDVAACCRELLRRFEGRAAAKHITMSARLPDQAVTLVADEEALRGVLENLLDNALKYTPDQGRVTLSVAESGPDLVFEVADTGIGIPQRHHERIFERFYRVDKARSRALGGTGLGLAIVKHLVIALDGDISLTSAPGRGSTFRVSLPRPPKEAVEKAQILVEP